MASNFDEIDVLELLVSSFDELDSLEFLASSFDELDGLEIVRVPRWFRVDNGLEFR